MAGITKNTPRDVVPVSSWYEKDPPLGNPPDIIVKVSALVRDARALEKADIPGSTVDCP